MILLSVIVLCVHYTTYYYTMRLVKEKTFIYDKIPIFYRAARSESGREARERFLRAELGRTQSERRHRLALAGGIRLSDGLE